MGNCRWNTQVERWLDGEAKDAEHLRQHVELCPDCAAFTRMLRVVRSGVQAVARHEEIGDSQFTAFIAGIRERVEQPQGGHYGFWALASVGTAALLVAVSTFLVMTGGPNTAKAQTVVESVSTELDDAAVGNYSSENGTATVWVEMPHEDLL